MATKTKKAKVDKTMIGSGVASLAVAGGVSAANLWTDHNTHDLGVTELELISYSTEDLNGKPKKPRYRQAKSRKEE